MLWSEQEYAKAQVPVVSELKYETTHPEISQEHLLVLDPPYGGSSSLLDLTDEGAWTISCDW
jgi:hypothetical protein